MNTEKKAYTLSILVEDIPGVLSQVARLFSRKGYNIESICAGVTTQPGMTRISVVTMGDEKMISQLSAQISKLLPVYTVDVLTGEDSVQRELVLIKVNTADKDARDEIIQIVNVFRASILDLAKDTLTIAMLGTADKTKAILNLLEEFGILEIARTGMVALERGRNNIHAQNKLKEEYNYGKTVL
ncbi:MAG: acetolactate synthase small subunit [Lachnospiraceae bacterium]|jgi:acetolactate synthase-1/3 small subunit|nr:acetolactate synthase small subunit [Lachnospiraceae bacterium]